ncbi:MAG: hypothetical protein NTW86_27890, partial [Candidatus Sumerlaeota bacterium]|nr:hypothetical protein [Candidatus Sumerlaeota bacterium]
AAALLATIVAGRWSGALLQGISTHLPFLIPDEYTPVIPLMRFQPLSVFSLFLLLGVLAFFQTKDRSIRVSALAAVVFFCFFCASYRKYDATEPWPGKAPYVEHMEERAGGGRFFALGTTMNTMLSAYFGLQDARMFGPTEPAQAYLLEYDLLLQNRPDNLAWEWYPISANNPQIALSPAMDLLDVRFLVREPYQPPMPAEAERDWRRVYEGEAEIWENRERPGRVFWTPAARYVGDAAEARRQVRAMGTAFQDCAILEGEPPRDWAPAAAPGAQRGKTWVEAYSCNRVVARVDAEQPGVVVLADAFYPRWRAFLDGRPTQVYRAYGALRAVHAPAGRHVIEFRYDTRPFVWGCAVSGASALLFVLGAAAPMTRRKFGMRPSGRHRFVRL